MDKKAEDINFEYVCDGFTAFDTEIVTESDNYMPQIDSVSAIKMKPQWTENDYDPTGFNRELENATIEERYMYSKAMDKKLKDKIGKEYNKFKAEKEKESDKQ